MQTKKLISQVGFSDFWPTVSREFGYLLEASGNIQSLCSAILNPVPSEKLSKVLRNICRSMANSHSALLILCMNGCGSDAMKIARSIFEGGVTVSYLKYYPEDVQSFLEFEHVFRKRLLDLYQRDVPQFSSGINELEAAEITEQYNRVLPRFAKGKSHASERIPRSKWSDKDLRRMAELVDAQKTDPNDRVMTLAYEWFYPFASSLHHQSMPGLLGQVNQNSFEIEPAPNTEFISNAVVNGTEFLLIGLMAVDEVTGGRQRQALAEFGSTFHKAIESPGF